MRGFVLLAHGARNPQWGALFETLAQDLGHAGQPARAAYLEYLQPDFGAAVDQFSPRRRTLTQRLLEKLQSARSRGGDNL